MKGPTVYRLAVARSCQDIVEHLADPSHHANVYWTDHYGSTALHILCQAFHVDHSLLKAVEAIAQIAPALIATPNHGTCTPLLYAVEKRCVWGSDEASTELVLLLLRYCPQAVLVTTQRGYCGLTQKTPFYMACQANADLRVLRTMLQIHPGLASEPYVKQDLYSVSEHPLQLVWNSRPTSARDNNASTNDKMALLLRAAYYGTVDDDNDNVCSDIRLLNAACSVRCPQDYFLQLVHQYSHQVRQLDDRNLLPLHYAIQNASVDSQPYTQFVLEVLLKLYPEAAAVPDEDGRLPLHVALMDRHLTWHKGGIHELVGAYPSALGIRDPLFDLYPFLAAACHGIKSMLHLSTTYELLRAAPDVMMESLVVR